MSEFDNYDFSFLSDGDKKDKKKKKKKKNKLKHYDDHGGIYNHETSCKIADGLSDYLSAVTTYVIIDDQPLKKREWAKNVIKEAIKDLRNGREDKVFNEEAYIEYVNRDL